jgi:hypothetical protein
MGLLRIQLSTRNGSPALLSRQPRGTARLRRSSTAASSGCRSARRRASHRSCRPTARSCVRWRCRRYTHSANAEESGSGGGTGAAAERPVNRAAPVPGARQNAAANAAHALCAPWSWRWRARHCQVPACWSTTTRNSHAPSAPTGPPVLAGGSGRSNGALISLVSPPRATALPTLPAPSELGPRFRRPRSGAADGQPSWKQPAIGWEQFARLIERSPLPVYALGGLQPKMLETARRHGADTVSR